MKTELARSLARQSAREESPLFNAENILYCNTSQKNEKIGVKGI